VELPAFLVRDAPMMSNTRAPVPTEQSDGNFLSCFAGAPHYYFCKCTPKTDLRKVFFANYASQGATQENEHSSAFAGTVWKEGLLKSGHVQ
jgi:hypothetical protein